MIFCREGFPRFLLHGISGTFNYGCEAMVRMTVAIIKEQWPECYIAYASRRPIEDSRSLEGCDVDVLDNHIPMLLSPRRILNSALVRLGRSEGWIPYDRTILAGNYDGLISIGGDIFTLWKPPIHVKPSIYQVDCANFVMDQGKKFILWGASIGPFDSWPSSIPVFHAFLSRCDLITVREPQTIRYLEKLGISSNVEAVADPAFLLPAISMEQDWPFGNDMTPVLGINLSPLSKTYTDSGKKQFVQRQATMVAEVVNMLGVNVLLIPHVIAQDAVKFGDFRHLQRLMECLPSNLTSKVRLLPPDLGARRTKGVIQKCEALIAARMHCAIAGVSCGTPTLLLSYSKKAIGMTEYVYGNLQWTCQVDRFHGDESVEMVKSLLDASKELRAYLHGAKDRFIADARNAGITLKKRVPFGDDRK